MNKFLKDIAARYNIEIEATIDFMSHFMIADIDKSELIVNKDGFNDEFYILKEGIIRAFIPTESEDRTIWFGYPGQAFFDVWCYHWDKPSPIAIEAVTPSVVYHISKNKLESLTGKSHSISNTVRKIFEGHAAEMEESITNLFICDGGLERYLSILKHHPELLQNVPLKKLASYMHLAPQSLSRIRSLIK